MADLELIPIDPITQKFTGADHKALAEALEKAFPNPNLLDQMLTARLDQSLNAIAAPYPLSQAAFDVVTFYKAKGHLLRLIASARASQPDNPALSYFHPACDGTASILHNVVSVCTERGKAGPAAQRH